MARIREAEGTPNTSDGVVAYLRSPPSHRLGEFLLEGEAPHVTRPGANPSLHRAKKFPESFCLENGLKHQAPGQMQLACTERPLKRRTPRLICSDSAWETAPNARVMAGFGPTPGPIVTTPSTTGPHRRCKWTACFSNGSAGPRRTFRSRGLNVQVRTELG